jgi:uncharacterized protein YjbI with pentapeptide repeats
LKNKYKKENDKYKNLIIEYRAVTQKVKDKEEKQQMLRKKNKKLPAETEHEVMFKDIKEDNLDYSKEPIELENKTYSFVKFTDTKIGKKAVLSESEMYELDASFWNVTFTNCDFQNVKFVNCRFRGCKFISCKTEDMGVVFEDCFFKTISNGNNNKGQFETNDVSSEFVNCHMTAQFRQCKLEKTIWDNCILTIVSFKDCTLEDSVFSGCWFNGVMLTDSDIAGMGILNMKKAELVFYGEYADSDFHKSTYIDLMSYKNSPPKDQTHPVDLKKMNHQDALDLKKMYYTLINCLKSKNSDIDFISEYRYQYQRHHMISKEKWYMQIWDRVSWILCGFGEKMLRFIGWFASIILVFALCYMFTGLQMTDRNIEYVIFGGKPFDLLQMLKDFGLCFHFSVVTLSTVGYGNITPLGWVSTLLCTIQIVLGLLFVATFTSIIIKKIIRE